MTRQTTSVDGTDLTTDQMQGTDAITNMTGFDCNNSGLRSSPTSRSIPFQIRAAIPFSGHSI